MEWLPDANLQTVTTAGDVTIPLTASGQPVAGATQLIRIPMPGGDAYAIERRSSYGDYDQGMSGVWVRIIPARTGNTTLLLDMTPATNTFTDGALAPGMTFTDAAHGITVRTLSDSGATASVQVCLGPCAPLPPGALTVVGVQGRTITVAGTDGSDTLTLTRAKKKHFVVSSPAPIVAGPGCTQLGTAVDCVVKRMDGYDVHLHGGDDQVTVVGKEKSRLDGGTGNDTFTGGKGGDVFVGGAGTDTVDYRNRTGTLTATPGTGPDDGAKREHDDIGADIESILLPVVSG